MIVGWIYISAPLSLMEANTDMFVFLYSLDPNGLELKAKKLITGNVNISYKRNEVGVARVRSTNPAIEDDSITHLYVDGRFFIIKEVIDNRSSSRSGGDYIVECETAETILNYRVDTLSLNNATLEGSVSTVLDRNFGSLTSANRVIPFTLVNNIVNQPQTTTTKNWDSLTSCLSIVKDIFQQEGMENYSFEVLLNRDGSFSFEIRESTIHNVPALAFGNGFNVEKKGFYKPTSTVGVYIDSNTSTQMEYEAQTTNPNVGHRRKEIVASDLIEAKKLKPNTDLVVYGNVVSDLKNLYLGDVLTVLDYGPIEHQFYVSEINKYSSYSNPQFSRVELFLERKV